MMRTREGMEEGRGGERGRGRLFNAVSMEAEKGIDYNVMLFVKVS